MWQKVAKFCHRKRKWGPEMLKNFDLVRLVRFRFRLSYVIGEQVIESFKLGYPLIASKAGGLATYRKFF